MGKILVIGGTGTMGTPLVKLLEQTNDDVHVVCRRKVERSRSKAIYHYGDILDVNFLNTILSLHYDAIIDFSWYSSQEFENRYRRLLGATNHYVCLSSAAVYANLETPKSELSPRYMETDPPENGTFKYSLYCYEKARIENILQSSNLNNWTIIRPGITINRNHFFWGSWIDETFTARIILGQPIVVPEDLLHYKISITYGGDVANMILTILQNPQRSLGEIYNTTSTIEYSWGDLLEVYRKIFRKVGYEIKEYRLENCLPFMNSESSMYQYQRVKLLDRRFDSSKIYSLGGVISTPIEPLLEEWVLDYIRNFYAFRIRTNYIDSVAKIDRLTRAKTHSRYFDSRNEYMIYLIERYVPKGTAIVYIMNKFVRKLKNSKK